MNFKMFSIVSLVFIAVSFSSCSKDDVDKELEEEVDNQNDPKDNPFARLIINVDKTIIFSDGIEETTFSAKLDTADVTDSVTYFIDDVEFEGNTFVSNEQDSYILTAKYRDYVSNSIKLFAVEEKVPVDYKTKILLEQYTASWCGYCPRLAYKLNDIKSQNSSVISVAIHGSDEMQYKYISNMAEKYNVSGYPTAVINRSLKWSENPSQLDNFLATAQKLGLRISSSVNAEMVSVKVSVGFAADLDQALKIVVFVVEDGLIYDQTNYYNDDPESPLYNLGDPIKDYVHNKVLQKSLTDVFGDPIPSFDDIFAGLYEWETEFDASSINVSNSHIVAFVMDDSFVKNVQIAKIGLTVDFE